MPSSSLINPLELCRCKDKPYRREGCAHRKFCLRIEQYELVIRNHEDVRKKNWGSKGCWHKNHIGVGETDLVIDTSDGNKRKGTGVSWKTMHCNDCGVRFVQHYLPDRYISLEQELCNIESNRRMNIKSGDQTRLGSLRDRPSSVNQELEKHARFSRDSDT